ncbi:MAG: hypothetical protein LBT57_02100, partial [Puniceicoccales bacterium]|nr:hypothetical protein [Puniceicoccales bacterium]
GFLFFDQGMSTARRALLATYKANRPAMPEALRQQLPILQELSQQMGYALRIQEGTEADDLIASTLAHRASPECECFVASADKDLAQCVAEGIILLRPSSQPQSPWSYFDAEAIRRHWGIAPAQMPDYLALVGDASDNIPGVPGVGPKTAQRWLQAFASIEGIYQNLEKLIPSRFGHILPQQRELLALNRQLICLDRRLPVPDECPPLEPRVDALIALLDRLGLQTLVAQARRRYGSEAQQGQLSLAL